MSETSDNKSEIKNATNTDDMSIDYCDMYFMYNKIQFRWNIIDLRNPKEFDKSHVYNSLNIHRIDDDTLQYYIRKFKSFIMIDNHNENTIKQYKYGYKLFKPLFKKKNQKIFLCKSGIYHIMYIP